MNKNASLNPKDVLQRVLNRELKDRKLRFEGPAKVNKIKKTKNEFGGKANKNDLTTTNIDNDSQA